MVISNKEHSIVVQDVRISLLNEYMSCIKEMLNAIKYIADANDHTSIVVLAQRVLSDVGNIDSIVKDEIQNRKENKNG